MKIIIENEEVGEFTYLGVLWQRMEIGKCRKEKNWPSIDNGSANYIWRSDGVSNGTKVKLYETFVVRVLLYGSECWCSSKLTIRSVPNFFGRVPNFKGLSWKNTRSFGTLNCPEFRTLSRICPDLTSRCVKRQTVGQNALDHFDVFACQRCIMLSSKRSKSIFGRGFAPDPAGGASCWGECTTLPQTS